MNADSLESAAAAVQPDGSDALHRLEREEAQMQRRRTLSETLSGWVLKQSVKNGRLWKRRWLLLRRRDSLLLVFHGEEQHEDRARHTIDLRLCAPVQTQLVPASDERPASRQIRVVAPNRTFLLAVEREDDFETWVEYLENAQTAARTAKAGYLLKQGGKVKNWKQRWFVLKDRQLLYYKSEEDARAMSVKGAINLHEALSIAAADERVGRPHSIAIETRARTYFLSAASDDERDDWLTVLVFHPAYPTAT